jgi:hypothetical protein
VATILVYGLAAAIYPQLLAVVAVILTRPRPQRLLWACYVSSISTSLVCGGAILLAFRDRASVAGSTSHRLGPSAYLTIGVLAVCIAVLIATRSGRALLGGSLPFVQRRRAERSSQAGSEPKPKSRTQRALSRGSAPVAIGVGVILGVPGPFDLLAVGRLARGGYAAIVLVVTMIAFNLVKFVLIEIPTLSYAVDPDRTAARVDRFSRWMKANKITVIAAVVGVIGAALIYRGASRLG